MSGKDKVIPSFVSEPISSYSKRLEPEGGLTKRELFAALVLQGFCSFPCDPEYVGDVFESRASAAVKQADALLAELAKASAK